MGKININSTRFGYTPETITIKVREPGSAFTHGAGLLLALIGAGPLLTRAQIYGSTVTYIAMWVFIISMCLLYGASMTYHTVVLDEKKTRILRKIDHMSICVLIAGTYTPICLTALKGRVGYILLAVIWAIAIGGMLIKAFWITCPKWFSSMLYIGMGWLCVAAFPAILGSLPLAAFLWLLIGGIIYTAGGVIYALKLKLFNARHKYFGSHEIFHLFVMGGTFCHYMMMYQFLAYIK